MLDSYLRRKTIAIHLNKSRGEVLRNIELRSGCIWHFHRETFTCGISWQHPHRSIIPRWFAVGFVNKFNSREKVSNSLLYFYFCNIPRGLTETSLFIKLSFYSLREEYNSDLQIYAECIGFFMFLSVFDLFSKFCVFSNSIKILKKRLTDTSKERKRTPGRDAFDMSDIRDWIVEIAGS